MRAGDGYLASNISADTAGFPLDGGLYGIDYIATWGGGSVTLERQAGDGSTFVTATTVFAANGYVSVYLPPGAYKLAIDTATAVYVSILRIPGE